MDTSVFYAFYNKQDVHHIDSVCLLTHIVEGKYGKPYTTDFVVSETFTLVRYRIGWKASVGFLQALEKSGLKVIFVDNEFFSEIIKILKRYQNKKLSFTDASLIYISESYRIDNLASYDERSFVGIVRNILGKNYAKTLNESEVERIMKSVEFLTNR